MLELRGTDIGVEEVGLEVEAEEEDEAEADADADADAAGRASARMSCPANGLVDWGAMMLDWASCPSMVTD